MSKKPDLSYIAEDLRPLAVETKTLTYDPANARTGHAIEDLMASLRVYGQRTPIVINIDENNKVEKGNGTLRAAIKLGWTHIAAVKVKDDPVTATGYAIADNRLSDLSYFDVEVLGQLLESLPDDDDIEIPTGFDEDEIAALTAVFEEPPSLEELEEKFGELDDDDYWPTVTIKVEQDVFDMFWSTHEAAPGEGDSEKLRNLLSSVDTAVMGTLE